MCKLNHENLAYNYSSLNFYWVCKIHRPLQVMVMIAYLSFHSISQLDSKLHKSGTKLQFAFFQSFHEESLVTCLLRFVAQYLIACLCDISLRPFATSCGRILSEKEKETRETVPVQFLRCHTILHPWLFHLHHPTTERMKAKHQKVNTNKTIATNTNTSSPAC